VDTTLDAPVSGSSGAELLLCPSCGEFLPVDAKFCPHDGQALSHDTVQCSGKREIIPGRDSLVGWVIDERYEVMQLLGEGGMGCVYRVRHRVLGRQFALKALRLELARDPVLAQRFVQEARAAAAINHPNVVGITDFGMLERGQPYFVMELLEGRTLGSALRDCRQFEPIEVVRIARTVASALSAAHAVGVIHRDLKPDNIILSGEARDPLALKVLDFGLAKLLGKSRLTQDDVVYGTPQYMSPEQAAGEPLDPRVDVYALGILMYEMLTGKVPFEADSYMGVLTKQLYVEPLPPSSSCPSLAAFPGLEQVVLQCLSKDRQARFADMSALIVALEHLLLDDADRILADSTRTRSPTLSSPDAGSRRHSRSRRRSLWWLYTWAGVATLGVALGVLFGRLSGVSSSSPPDAHAPSARAVPASRAPTAPPAVPILPPEPTKGTPQTPEGKGEVRIPPVASGSGSGKVRTRAGVERSPGQSKQVGHSESPRGGSAQSFGSKGTSGSSEIANPWAE